MRSVCLSALSKRSKRSIDAAARKLAEIRERGGRFFLAGSGGGAGHASHATCDFRKLCNIETYSAYDNVSELTARINDEGWETTLSHWLKVSRFNERDGLLILSVGGGSRSARISLNLVYGAEYAKSAKGWW
jgi:D-sedoheptulose 7-phosphate isomerase